MDQEATVQELVLRRFRCCACGAVVTVGPDELVPRRLFSVTSIAMALFLWAASLWSPVRVRERLSPWKRMGATAAAGWATLRRWARQAVGGLLWPTVGSGPGQGTLREQAAGVVRRLDIHAGLTPSLPGVVAGAKRHGG